jgi:hypothetical protein
MTFPLKEGYTLLKVHSFKNASHVEAVCRHPNGSVCWVRTPVEPAAHGVCVMCREKMTEVQRGHFMCRSGHPTVMMDTRMDSTPISKSPKPVRLGFRKKQQTPSMESIKQQVADALEAVL